MTQKRIGWLHFLRSDTNERVSAPAFVELLERDAQWGEKARFVLKFRHPLFEGSLDWDSLRDAARAQGKQAEARLWKPIGFIPKSRALREAIAERLTALAAQSLSGPSPLEGADKLVRRVRLDEWDAGWSSDLAWDPAMGLGSTPKLLTELALLPGLAPEPDAEFEAWMGNEVSPFGGGVKKTAAPRGASSDSRSRSNATVRESLKAAAQAAQAAQEESDNAKAEAPSVSEATPAAPAALVAAERRPALETRAEPPQAAPVSAAAQAPEHVGAAAPSLAPRPHALPARPMHAPPAAEPQSQQEPRPDPAALIRPIPPAPARPAQSPIPDSAVSAAAVSSVGLDDLDELDEFSPATPAQAPVDKNTVRFATARFPTPSDRMDAPGQVDWSNALFSCQTYLSGDSFEAVKGCWAGKIEREGKNETLFTWKAIDALRSHGHAIEVDGLAWADTPAARSSREFVLAAWAQNADAKAQAIVGRSKLKALAQKTHALWSSQAKPWSPTPEEERQAGWQAGFLGETAEPAKHDTPVSYSPSLHALRRMEWKETGHEDFSASVTFERLDAEARPKADEIAREWLRANQLAPMAPKETPLWADGFDGEKAKLNADRSAKPAFAARRRFP